MRTAIIVTDATEATLRGGITYVRPEVAVFARELEHELALIDAGGSLYIPRDIGRFDLLTRLSERIDMLLDDAAELPSDYLREHGAPLCALLFHAIFHNNPRPTDSGITNKE